MSASGLHRGVIAVLVSLLVIVGTAGPVAAEARSGGTVIVGEGQTVTEDLDAFAGQIVVRGTVDGDFNAFGGDVVIADSGVVTGDVAAFGGSVRVERGARIGAVYGQFAVGTWIVSLVDGSGDSGWGALVLGVLLVSLFGLVPVLGGIVQLLVSLLGLGALAFGLRTQWRGRRRTVEPTSGAGTEAT